MADFTPIASFVGGLLVGLASVLVLYVQGRLAGISGILSGLLARPQGDSAWRAAFLGGMVLAGLTAALLVPAALEPAVGSPLRLLGAGLLVGFGTRLANGCTSGHGICGVGRFSRRSLVATATFMAVAILTVAVQRWMSGS